MLNKISIELLSKNIFSINFQSLTLMSFWFIGILFIKNLLSSELTAKLGLKTPVKQIDTLEELVNSNIKLIVADHYSIKESMKIANQDLVFKINNKALKDKTFLDILEILTQDKWIKGVADGQNAIFLFEGLISIIISDAQKMLKDKCRFRYLPEEFGSSFQMTIASSKRLVKQFREKLNLR